jgi:hypothetical protein
MRMSDHNQVVDVLYYEYREVMLYRRRGRSEYISSLGDYNAAAHVIALDAWHLHDVTRDKNRAVGTRFE